MAFSIRVAEPADADGWQRMRALLLPEDGNAQSEIKAYFREGPTDQIVFLAQYGGAPQVPLVGFVEIGTRDYAEGCATSPVAYIEALYVDPGYHRAGIGRQLMNAAETWAKGQGLNELASDVRWNSPVSQAAHLAYGFIEAERIVCFCKRL